MLSPQSGLTSLRGLKSWGLESEVGILLLLLPGVFLGQVATPPKPACVWLIIPTSQRGLED